MSDETPRPGAADETAETAAPAPAAAGPVNEPAARPAGGRWWNRRVPLLVIGAALVLGCLLGGGVVAVGALVGDFHGGDDRGHFSRDDRADRRGNDGGIRPGRGDNRGNGRRGDGPDKPAPTPAPSTSSAPTPQAS
jgi:hypothetical protein